MPLLFVATLIIIPAIISEAPKITPPPHIQAKAPIDSARFCGYLSWQPFLMLQQLHLQKLKLRPSGIAILVITLLILSVAVCTSAVPILSAKH